ncbi:MAG: hypothetical protein IJS39_08465, partial [Synergistaceae bacterium]|nr:hypothetical protein [Synergistaceae bacterium]
IAQKYLNVCVPQAHNCSKCVKCLRTLIVIDSMGKLRDFSRVFDIETYRKVLFRHKCDIMLRKNGDGFLTDQYTFARSHGMHFPSYITAYAYMFPFRLLGFFHRKGCPQNHRLKIL